jgi:hypothetical protein
VQASLAFASLDARSSLLPIICCELPLLDTLSSRFVSFVAKCFSSDSFTVRSIVRFGLYEGGMHSLVKRNALFVVTDSICHFATFLIYHRLISSGLLRVTLILAYTIVHR